MKTNVMRLVLEVKSLFSLEFTTILLAVLYLIAILTMVIIR